MATIALFMSSYGDGGAHKNMLNIAGWLEEQGHDVDLVVAKAEGKLEHEIPKNVSVYDLASSRTRYSIFGLWRYIWENQPDSLLATPTTCTLVAGIVDHLIISEINIVLRIPAILSNEPYYTQPRDPVEKLFPMVTKWVYQRSDQIVAISKGVKSDLVSNFNVEKSDIEVVYNPVITDDISEKMVERVEHSFFQETSHVYIAVGRLVNHKGFNTLIKSFKKVREHTDAKLIILGDGKLREELITLTEDLSISSDVSFPGFVKNPYKYMYKADTFVLSSRTEGFGNVVVEALACGTPVVATDCEGGPSEILNDGEFGSLVPVDNVSQLADAMISSLDNVENRNRLQKRAHEFHIDKIAPKYESILLQGKN